MKQKTYGVYIDGRLVSTRLLPIPKRIKLSETAEYRKIKIAMSKYKVVDRLAYFVTTVILLGVLLVGIIIF
jgi:hypothetical protein